MEENTKYTLVDPIECTNCGHNMHLKDMVGTENVRKYWTCDCGNYTITDIDNITIFNKVDEDTILNSVL